jgi:hypothetical protein
MFVNECSCVRWGPGERSAGRALRDGGNAPRSAIFCHLEKAAVVEDDRCWRSAKPTSPDVSATVILAQSAGLFLKDDESVAANNHAARVSNGNP